MTISLAGRVVDDTGVGLNNATVQAYVWGQTSVAPNGSTVTANDAQGLPGYWSLPNLADALYVVQVSYFGKTRTTYGPSQVQFNEIVIGANKALIDNNGNLTLSGSASISGQTKLTGPLNTSLIPSTWSPTLILDDATGSSQNILEIRTVGARKGSLRVDNLGNVVLNPSATGALYLSWDEGSGGVVFGNGVGTNVASVDKYGNATFSGYVDVKGTLTVENGAILKGQASVGTTDLGLYSGGATNAIRLVTNGGDIRLFKDGGAGATPSLTVNGGSGGVYIGTTPTDPGVNNLTVQSDIYLGARSASLSSWLNQALKTTDGPTFANVTAGTFYGNSGLRASGNPVQNVQGSYLGWNRSNGTGEINFVDHHGGGPGGFFWDVTGDGATYTTVMTLDSSGNLKAPGIITGQSYVMSGSMRTHRHPYSNDRHIESGSVNTPFPVAAGLKGTNSFTFFQPYTYSNPTVVATTYGNQPEQQGTSVASISATGATINMNNDSTSSLVLQATWISEGA